MRASAGAYSFLVFGIVLGFIWSGGCSDDHTSQAAPAQSASGAPLFCYVGAPSANSSVWSLNGGGAGSENTTLMPAPRASRPATGPPRSEPNRAADSRPAPGPGLRST